MLFLYIRRYSEDKLYFTIEGAQPFAVGELQRLLPSHKIYKAQSC